MNAADRALALRVPCPLCKMPAEAECVNSVDGRPREEPHYNRPVRARLALSAIADNLDLPPNAGSAS